MIFRTVFLYRANNKGGAYGGLGSGAAHLIEQLQKGDLKALGELFERYRNLVYRTAFAIIRDERAAEDVLQECFVRLYTYADSIDSNRPLEPWLYRVTVNLAYDWSTKKSRGQSIDEVLEWLSGLPGGFPPPDHKTEEKEMLSMVQDVIAKLAPSHRAVIVLFYMENLSVDDIANVLELPVGTVKSRLHYARERLRESLEKRQRPVPEVAYEFT
ncbi:MAG: sigma-70 family RNA polymerase sigma factor [Anaerolineae bacterium]|nr:sigma-70 family RNA polymerase sigma factor [Anaerolineae bacterium]